MTVTINGTTGIAGTNGSAGTPAVQGEDTNTGIFFPAADTVAVATAGTERVTVTSVGRVGVGTNSPNQLVHVSGGNIRVSSSSENTIITNGGNFTTGAVTDSAILYGSGSLLFGNGSTERMRLDASGNLGIGVTPSSQPLEIKRGAGTGAFIESAGNNNTPGSTSAVYGQDGSGNAFAWNRANLPLLFGTNNTERARITDAGTLLIGRTANVSATTRLGLDTTASIAGFVSETGVSTATTHARFYNPNGNVGNISTNASATTYATSSDYRLKENVAPMQNALDTVAQLNPVTYTWKADGSAGQGFIAHELQAVVPDCVTGEKDAVDAEGNPQYQGVDTSFLVATLVKAIQELTARVAQLEAQ